ncbi:DUF3134 family protein [Leptolyngbya sp. FACHB-16]|uniref:DUF3134 family protein n=1 Tax=unclassified Leptolyngbya TaxID=2650499 RepID=UPI001682A82C|nr:DUF3134 family protein [Leptolyngbya sp. FACHB-16]MBD2158878.1 DUF3134 family protein [Leptolyngbya sp. FACHB-16]
MAKHNNPALSEEPRNQPVKAVPPIPRETLFGWLERTSRFHSGSEDKFQEPVISEDVDEILDPEVYVFESEEESMD